MKSKYQFLPKAQKEITISQKEFNFKVIAYQIAGRTNLTPRDVKVQDRNGGEEAQRIRRAEIFPKFSEPGFRNGITGLPGKIEKKIIKYEVFVTKTVACFPRNNRQREFWKLSFA